MASLASRKSRNGGGTSTDATTVEKPEDDGSGSSTDSESGSSSSGSDSDSDNELTEEQYKMMQERIKAMQAKFKSHVQKQERNKLQDLKDIVPGLTDEEAILALELCNDNDIEAQEQLKTKSLEKDVKCFQKEL